MTLSTEPVRRRPFSRAEFERLAELGLFDGERLELIDGEILRMSPKGSRHAATVTVLNRTLVAGLGDRAVVRVQDPLALDERTAPEPDLAICCPDPSWYSVGHPTGTEVMVVIEVAESSLAYDRGVKVPLYAAAGIPTYVIVDLVAGQVELYTEPQPELARYGLRRIVSAAESLDLVGVTVPVGALLG